MKYTLRFVCLFLLAVVLQNCSEDENLTKEQVQFTFDLNSLNASGGRVRTTNLPDDSKVLISIQKGDGTPLFTFHEIEILRIGSSLITLPLELTGGSYKITDFLIVNNNDEILFGTPKKGSPLASYVSRPLDINFSVRANQLNNIQMEVVDAYQNAPEDFGYVSFNINIVNPLSIAVFRPNGNTLQMTSAKAYIIQNDDTLQTFNLAARVNRLGFKQEKSETYTLMVVKGGYTLYKRDFIYDDLMTELAGQPIKVILSPALTLINFVEESLTYSFKLQGPAGSTVTVNWGDGSFNEYDLATDNMFDHTYAASGNYFISVVGNLDEITSFYSFYGQGLIDEINLQHLPELREMIMGLSYRSPRVIDLSYNTKLEFLNMPNLGTTQVIDLPASNNISTILIPGPNKLTSAAITEIINDVYANAVATNRKGGTFEFTENWYGLYGGMVAIPTPEALEKLRELQNVYGWTVYPTL